MLRSPRSKLTERYADMDAMYAALEQIIPALRGIEVPASARKPTSSTAPGSDSEILSSVSRRPSALTLGAVGSVVLALAVFFLMPHGHTHPPVASVTPAAPVVPPVPPPVKPMESLPPAPPQGEATVELALSSMPPNSQVFLDDELLGITPITVKRTREADGKVSLIFRKSGYKDTERVVPISANGYVVVELPHETVAAKKAPATHGGPTVVPPVSPVSAPVRKPSEKPGDQPNRHNAELRDPF